MGQEKDNFSRVLASIFSFLLILKAFDWMRLFQSTGFYVMLVRETLNDIQAFMILLIAVIMMFAIPMLMLNLNRSDAEDNLLIDPVIGFAPLDAFINQYLLALGEFSMDHFDGNPQTQLIYTFFIMATFFTQITMLNMLIAIMGDTFERITENKEINATKTKLELIADLAEVLDNRMIEGRDGDYLYIVTPTNEDDGIDSDW